MKTEPLVGMGATIYYHSDRAPATIIQITQSGKRLVLQEDKSTRLDNNGMSECQVYEYQPDSEGKIFIATKRKHGEYRLVGEKTLVDIGTREKYYDYSF